MYENLGIVMGIGITICFASPRTGITVIALALGAIIGYACWEVFNSERLDKLRARLALVERADKQHEAVLRGDPYGMYGEYPPADLRQRHRRAGRQ